MTYIDSTFFPASIAMLDCLTDAVSFISIPPLRKAIRAGAAVAFDISQNTNECCDGLAWVREGDIFPSSDFPTADTTANKCLPVWAFELEIGIIRCAPVGTINDTVTDDEHLQTALLLSEDIAAIRRALCCFIDAWEYAVAIGRIAKVGPEGGCMGNLATLTVQAIPRDTWPS